jgi:predicted RNA-binding Zn-ribbon protein involved in translation (DUF1610 family)
MTFLTEKQDVEIAYTLSFLSSCPIPPKIKRSEIEGNEWIKKIGNTEIKITGSKELGCPYGRDLLIILYLIIEALKQKDVNPGYVYFPSLDHYLKTFHIVSNTNSYEEAKKRFQRIYDSTFFLKKTIDNKIFKFRFNVIRSWNVYFDPENQNKALFDSCIELSGDFWKMIKDFKTPYDLNTVIHLKQSPAVLNFYLFLVLRTYYNWKVEKRKVFIPFFGDSGLQIQLSSDIQNKRHFKAKIIDWLDKIKEVWPGLPASLEVEKDVEKKGRNKSKKFKDCLVIKVTNSSQLHVPPDFFNELGHALKKSSPPCPDCGKLLSLREGKKFKSGLKLDNYYRCPQCKKNYYHKDYPHLYKTDFKRIYQNILKP